MSSAPPASAAAMPPAPPVLTDFTDLWSAFWDWTGGRPGGAYLFRGQADRSEIVPKIGRKDYTYDPSRERLLFDAFKRAARAFLPGALANDFEWLALAQHHGAPTRLVDWSTSPLVAAWFATTSYPNDTDAVVFGLDLSRRDLPTCEVMTGMTSTGMHITDPLQPNDGVFLIETAPVSPRITTQRGIFTVHGSPTTPLAVPDGDVFIIPKGLRSDFQGQLLDIGIDASHIFPDLDGLCRTFDWRLRSGKGFSAFT